MTDRDRELILDALTIAAQTMSERRSKAEWQGNEDDWDYAERMRLAYVGLHDRLAAEAEQCYDEKKEG